MAADQGSGRIFYGWWISALMLYFLIFAGGFGLYGYPVYIPRFEAAFGWTRTQVVGSAAAWAIVYGFSGPLIGALIQRLGARRWLAIATAACAGSYLLISMIDELWQLYACVGLLGITIGGTTLVPAQTVVTTWFDSKRGRAMGIVMMGIGIGGRSRSRTCAPVRCCRCGSRGRRPPSGRTTTARCAMSRTTRKPCLPCA